MILATMFNQTKNKTIVSKLSVADNFKARAQGLIGRTSMDSSEGIWFPNSNWIHTFFMSMPIDVIYLNKKMQVAKLQPGLKPWRFPAPVFKAKSVLEVNDGFIEKNEIQLGDIFHVGD